MNGMNRARIIGEEQRGAVPRAQHEEALFCEDGERGEEYGPEDEVGHEVLGVGKGCCDGV